MTDLEITRLCAEAMGYTGIEPIGDPSKADSVVYREGWIFRPLKDDAQAMALVKKFALFLEPRRTLLDWQVRNDDSLLVNSENLNRAICECVAHMQKAKINPR